MSYTVIRKPMKYMRIVVNPDLSVVVSAPKRVSNTEIEKFVESKKERIIKAQEHYKKAKSLVAVAENEVLLHGLPYKIIIDHEKHLYNARSKGWIIDHELHTIKSPVDLTLATNQKAWYLVYAKAYLADRLQTLANKYEITYSRFIMRSQKTKRGTCSSQKIIGLNRKLVKMPHEISDYVICHELAHIKHMNHSKDFWAEVGRLCPDYKQANTWMKKYGVSLQ